MKIYNYLIYLIFFGLIISCSNGVGTNRPSTVTGTVTNLGYTNNGQVVLEIQNGKISTLYSIPTSTTQALTDISCSTSNTCVAVGNNGTIISSTDFINWTQANIQNITNISTTTNFSNIVTTSTGFLVGGQNGVVLYSPDGINWNQVQVGTNQNVNDIIVGNNGVDLILIGNNGYIARSTNGGSIWSTLTSGVTTNLNQAFNFNGILIIVGSNGTILTSNNELNWNIQASGVTNNLNTISCSLNFCAVGGDNSTILASNNGNIWQTQTAPLLQDELGTLYSYNVEETSFNALDGTISMSGYLPSLNSSVMISFDGANWYLETQVANDNLKTKYTNNVITWLFGKIISRGVHLAAQAIIKPAPQKTLTDATKKGIAIFTTLKKYIRL